MSGNPEFWGTNVLRVSWTAFDVILLEYLRGW